MLRWLSPETYLLKIVSLIIGCVILALGVYFEVIANVVMLPGEAFVKAVTVTFKTDFGTTKVCFDASMTIIAGITSFAMFGAINGVREGTVIAALIVGFISKFWSKKLQWLTDILLPENRNTSEEAVDDKQGDVILE
jgi:uncharacterized membrane protein YczE